MLGGMGERFDVVTTMSGLPDFSAEYSRAREFSVDGVTLKVLPLERIIASKRAANRSKDQVALQNLELTLKLLGK
jgi:predicted nucleotidyltransferase